MLRPLLAIVIATAVATALFWLMHYLILSGDGELNRDEGFRTVDFVRVQQEERVETRERARPDPPQPDQPPPPPPQMQAQTAQARHDVMPIGMPSVDVPTSVSGGPGLAESSELIPLVRLSPQYPRQAARARISGWVRLRIVVNPDGSVREARAIDADPRGLFEAAAVTAAQRGRFRPRVVDGEPVQSSGEYTVRFNIGD